MALLALLAALALSFPPRAAIGAEGEASVEYALKAAFLLNFTMFVEWPADAFKDDKSPLVIGVIGKDPFGKVLDQVFTDKKAGTRDFVVRRLPDPTGIEACHVLFIASSESERRRQIAKALEGKGVLTVAEFPDFAEKEGIIQFVMQENKIRLAINVDNARGARLRISANLLRLATIFRKKEG
jgi:hypothetical protein